MCNILLHSTKFCRNNAFNCLSFNSLLTKKFINIIVPSSNFVNKAHSKSSASVHLTENVNKVVQPKGNIFPAWKPTPSANHTNLLQYYLKLSKIRLTSLVVVTSLSGYFLAPAPFMLDTFVWCFIGTGLLSSAANAINQFHEVPFDAQMNRTKHRVLVSGQLTPLHAMMFSSAASLVGLSVLYLGVNGLTGTLGLANLILYAGIYTPMKRMSILNTWVGSIVGAIPPLMGWAACANSLGSGAWLMAALLYSWQFPHFNALSWNLRPEYSRAGYRMMAVTNPELCKKVALRHTIALQGITILAPILDVTNYWFLLGATPLNLYFIYLAHNFYKDASSQTSRKLFRFSLIHLPLLMGMLLLCKIKFNPHKDDLKTTYNDKLSSRNVTEL